MIKNTVELRILAITISKEYVKDAKSLIETAKELEEYIHGTATIPDVVEDSNSALYKCLEEYRKSLPPVPPVTPEPSKTE